MADQPRPSTSRGEAEASRRAATGFGQPSTSPQPGGSRRRSSSPAAWPPRPAAMSLDSDDDDTARPAATYSSQGGGVGGVESLDPASTPSPPPAANSRGKQPATESRAGVNMAAKNRHRQSSVVTSSVTSESADDASSH